MTDKEQVFSNIRKALGARKKSPRPEVNWGRLVAERRLGDEDPWVSFQRNFQAVRGKFCEDIDGLALFLQEQDCLRGYCDPSLRGNVGEPLEKWVRVEYEYGRDKVDELQFAITAGSAVIAETGTIILNDGDTSNRLAAVAPWVHVAAILRNRIYRSVPDALRDFDKDPNIIWVTGPSKTADVEGILIEGVHGPGEQVCLPVDP